MKIHKTPYKCAIKVPKMTPGDSRPPFKTDDLSCQKSQNAYEIGGVLREKKNERRRFRRKNKKYILKS